MSFPYLARTTLKYKSPHASDLSFAKDETIRVTGPSDDDEDWLVGETLDGTKKGGFPKDFVTPIDENEETGAEPHVVIPPAGSPESSIREAGTAAGADTGIATEDAASPPPVPVTAPAPPSPKPEPVSLPPSTTASPAPPPAGSAAPPAGDGESPAKQSMKDRLAFFAAAQNKPAPPPVKPKPAAGGLTWSQRQKLRQEQDAKEKEAGGSAVAPASPAPAAAPTPTPVSPAAPPEAKKKEDAGAGLSAADAQSSISKGGSLRERMAALQGAGAFGAPAEKPAAPVPSGKTWKRPPAPEPEPGEESEFAAEDSEPAIPLKTPAGEQGDELSVAGAEGGEGEEETEEEREKAKRAAIAARMAKLGGRGPMGMAMPPKPARKPTRESLATSPSEEKTEPVPARPAETAQPRETSVPATSPPVSIPIASMPRRTAPPRRRAPASSSIAPSTADDVQAQASASISPPLQVMVADEEKPLPKTQEQLAIEKEEEQIGQGSRGAQGAAAAGIAIVSTPRGQNKTGSQSNQEPLVGAIASPGSQARGLVTDRGGLGEVLDGKEDQPHEIEEGIEEGGEEKDDLMEEAERGDLEFVEPEEEAEAIRPQPVAMVPLHPPAEQGHRRMSVEPASPPPPPRMMGVPMDEVEMKHQHDAAVAQEEAEEAGPPPPSRRPVSTDRPLGPRPLPSPSRAQVDEGANRHLPAPPMGKPMIPPRNEEEEDREADGEGDEEVGGEEGEVEEEAPAPPPPRRQPSIPAPLSMTMPMSTSPQSPYSASPVSSRGTQAQQAVPTSPIQRKAVPTFMDEEPATPTGEDEEKARRSGIAARMAKLGGVKFGMAPPPLKKQSTSSNISMGQSEAPLSPIDAQQSPIDREPPLPSPMNEAPQTPTAMSAPIGEETPEAEAARKRSTLARLRAGGALGFGMFNHGPASPSAVEDTRGLESELAVSSATEQAPPVPTGRPSLPPPPAPQEEEEEGQYSAPLPAGPPPVPTGRPMPVTPMEEDAPPPPLRPTGSSLIQSSPFPQSPVRTTSINQRPPIPSPEQRMSQQSARNIPPPTMTQDQSMGPSGSQSSDWQMVDEPAVLMMNQPDFQSSPPPPPPGRPAPIQTHSQSSQSPRRSLSSHTSRMSMDQQQSPITRQMSSSQEGDPSRASLNQNRPGFNELQQASREHGSRIARAAKATFDQGRKAYYGDGSPAGFVLVTMDNAHVPRPQQAWGALVYEQDGASVLRRYDEPRPGDIVAMHDARLKGKKGLQSYNQHVGSVEEPLVGIVAEFDSKNKHKMRVLQVERGVPEEVSYRCDDLKSGRILVYRPGM